MIIHSKFKPGMTAEVMGTVDHRGAAPAFVTDPDYEDGQPYAAAIFLEEWSETPTVVVPPGTPEIGYLVFIGEGDWIGEKGYLVFSEDDAIQIVADNDWIGYAPITIPRVLLTSK